MCFVSGCPREPTRLHLGVVWAIWVPFLHQLTVQVAVRGTRKIRPCLSCSTHRDRIGFVFFRGSDTGGGGGGGKHFGSVGEFQKEMLLGQATPIPERPCALGPT